DESTESQLVKIENLKLVDPAQWTGTGPGFNVDVTDEVNTYQMRIDNDVDLYSMPAPSGTFNLTGIGGQFDNASPYLEGYQLLPRYMEDIDLMSGTVDQRLGAAISFFPNPTRSQLTVQSQEVLDVIRVSTLTGQSVLEVQRPESTETIDLSKLENGAYLITFVKGNSIWVEQFFKF
ncbi:MAG TPA: T9SS type A sorting domain-containing protein, partial [Saprospiraceae bacterium]|nr:T9SS type A sorting domain-containing protein [Saprospiraceae bacterium]